MNNEFEVIIIGASLAGCCLAVSLARQGVEVCLLEKDEFPRRLACGEGLSVAGAEYLNSLLDTNLFDSPHQKLNEYLILGKNRTFQVGGRSADTRVIGVRRAVLDDLLLKRIRDFQNITLLTSTHIKRLVQRSGGTEAQCAGGDKIRGSFAVVATGKSRSILKEGEFEKYVPRKPKFGMSTHFRLTFERSISRMAVAVKDDFEIYCTPVGAGYLNLNILAGKPVIGNLRRGDFLSKEISKLFDSLDLQAEQVFDFVGAGPFGQRAKKFSSGRIVLVGDALESLDPVGGMGMTHAMVTAARAQKYLLSKLQNHDISSGDLKSYISPHFLRFMTSNANLLVRGVANSNIASRFFPDALIELGERSLQWQLRRLV